MTFLILSHFDHRFPCDSAKCSIEIASIPTVINLGSVVVAHACAETVRQKSSAAISDRVHLIPSHLIGRELLGEWHLDANS